MRQSGLLLILGGLLGIAFFLATDARISPRWTSHVGWSPNLVDAAHDAITGTIIGIAGSLLVMCVGLWLVIRKSI